MASTVATQTTLNYLKDLWDDSVASGLDEAELLRYRSNLLGADLRITNFAGGNTSTKATEIDPLTGQEVEVLWVKGSGGDLGSMKRSGLASLYLEKLHALEHIYRGVDFEDEMADMYPLCTFRNNPVAASIDTPLHGFLPFKHVDHLHPDWAIALAASANGLEKMAEFNQRFGHQLVWIPWQRPGFELGMMMKTTIEANPDCDGIVLGGHGLFTWGETHRESYLTTITIIDQLGQFVIEHVERKGDGIFGGQKFKAREDRSKLSLELLPYLRGQVSNNRRVIASFTDLPEVLKFVNSRDGDALAYLGTSCPDHFIRTKIRPLYVKWDPSGDVTSLKAAIADGLKTYRKEYAEYYQAHAQADSPAMRDDNPSIVLVPGIGMFSFGKSKPESRITGEFYTNAIHVMEGASAMGEGAAPRELPQAGPAAHTSTFKVHTNYVALPALEAFRIEYWRLEEAKIRRQPPEKQLSRQIAVVVGGGSGIGREVALLAAERGAHVVIADRDFAGAEAVTSEVKAIAGKEFAVAVERGYSQSRDHPRGAGQGDWDFWGDRHPDQHCGDFSSFAGRRDHGCAMGALLLRSTSRRIICWQMRLQSRSWNRVFLPASC